MEELKSELSEREVEILKLVATGLSNKEIAARVNISPNTVKVHLRNIFLKINVVSRTEATLYAIRGKYVEVGEGFPSETSTSERPQAVTPEETITTLTRPSKNRGRATIIASLSILIILTVIAVTTINLFPEITATTNPPPRNPTFIPQWEVRADMPTARAGLATTLYDNYIYAIAGETEDGPTTAVERYNPNTNTWQTLKPKPSAVSDVQAAVIGGRIYVPGGLLANGQPIDTLEIYDPMRDTWEIGKHLPKALSAYALVAFEGKLFLFGGWNGKNYQSTVYEYNPDNDEWRVKTSMPNARGFLGAVTVGGKIFVIGGTDGKSRLDANYIYLPQADNGVNSSEAWMEARFLPETKHAAGITAVIDVIYVFGGEASTTPSSIKQSWSYDTKTNNWSVLDPKLSLDIARLGAIADGTRIFIIGGEKDAKPLAQNLRYQLVYIVPLPQISP